MGFTTETDQPQEAPMFQRFAVTFTATDQPKECYTASLVDLDEGDPKEQVAKQLACRRYGRADMADHFELVLTPIGRPSPTPRPYL